MGLNLFGSSAKSSTSNQSQNAAFSEVAGPASSYNVGGSMGGGKNSTNNISITDSGAIQGALSLAGLSLNQVELAGNRAGAQVSAAIDAVSANARSDSENFGQQAIKWGAIVAVVIALAWAATKAKG